MSYKTIEELDKGGVELVWVAAKREDADRKLGLKISQEMHVLRDHANTTFVIISSDQDFRHHMQVLINAGYAVIIIHNALKVIRQNRWKCAPQLHIIGTGMF